MGNRITLPLDIIFTVEFIDIPVDKYNEFNSFTKDPIRIVPVEARILLVTFLSPNVPVGPIFPIAFPGSPVGPVTPKRIAIGPAFPRYPVGPVRPVAPIIPVYPV